VDDVMNWEGCANKLLQPILKYHPSICLEEMMKYMKISFRVGGLHTEIQTQDPPDYKAGALSFCVTAFIDRHIQCKTQEY